MDESVEKKSSVGPLIAERELICDKGKRRVTVRLHAPVFVDPRTWVCRIEILGLKKPILDAPPGADAFQALELALDGIRYYLERAGVDCTWVEFGDEGDHGFRRLVPHHDRAFAERIDQLIDREALQDLKEVAKRNAADELP